MAKAICSVCANDIPKEKANNLVGKSNLCETCYQNGGFDDEDDKSEDTTLPGLYLENLESESDQPNDYIMNQPNDYIMNAEYRSVWIAVDNREIYLARTSAGLKIEVYKRHGVIDGTIASLIVPSEDV